VKILILNVLHEWDDKRVFQKIGRSLAQADHEVVSIVPSASPLSEAEGVRFRTIAPAHSLPNRFLSVFRLIRRGYGEAPATYFAVEPESWVAALCLKGLSGGKVVFDMHEHVPTEFAKFFPKPLQGAMTWLTRRIMHLFARYTDLIILTRDSFEPDWSGSRTPRVTVINTNHLQAPCSEIPSALASYQAAPTIIHQGVFGDVRGSWQLLDAMKIVVREMPAVRCIILGDYVYGSREAYEAAIKEAGLQENMLLLGRVAYDAVPAYIAVSRIGLILFQPGLINHLLAMPHKLFDYMREAVPVVAPAFSLEVRRIVEESGCGLLVDVTAPEAIAAALLELLRDEEKARSLGAKGRQAVEQKYHWQHDEVVLLNAIAQLEER